MSKNQKIFGVTIENMTNLGYGAAHLPDGRVVFVKNAVTNDVADIKIIKDNKDYSVAICEHIVKPSPYRISPDCPVFEKCGGCVFRHIDYEYEKKIKEDRVKECFRKYAGIEIEPESPVTFSCDRYRNNVRFPLGKDKKGKIIAGFYSEYSHRLVPVSKCLTQKSCFDTVLNESVRIFNEHDFSVYDETTGSGHLRYLCLRCSRENEISVCIVINSNDVSSELSEAARDIASLDGVCGVYANFNAKKTNVIFGEKTVALYESKPLYETICGSRFAVSPRSFFQINTETAELLYNKAKEYLSSPPGGVIVDLYCGTGTIGICTSSADCALYGCDIVPEAIENAVQNAKDNGIISYRYDCADASKGIRACLSEYGRIDSLIVDPPRKGLSSDTVSAMIESGVNRFVYISCNPDTLARDAAVFVKSGYKIEKCALYDLFPRTSHVETVVLLSREKIDDHLEFTWTDKEFGHKIGNNLSSVGRNI